MNGFGMKESSRTTETMLSRFAVCINWNHPLMGFFESSASRLGLDTARESPWFPSRRRMHKLIWAYSLVWKRRIRLLRLEPTSHSSLLIASRLSSSIHPSIHDTILLNRNQNSQVGRTNSACY